jgi:hypothetical protein
MIESFGYFSFFGKIGTPITICSQWRLIMEKQNVRYVSDNKGDITDVIVPIDLWRKIEAHQDDTEYLLSSEPMKNRLLESIRRNENISLEDTRARVGL